MLKTTIAVRQSTPNPTFRPSLVGAVSGVLKFHRRLAQMPSGPRVYAARRHWDGEKRSVLLTSLLAIARTVA
jgi:hypothetical protein